MGSQKEDPSYFTHTSVEGVQCVVTSPVNTDSADADKEKQARKKAKDRFLASNCFVPVLDTKLGERGKEYCDIIFSVRNITQ